MNGKALTHSLKLPEMEASDMLDVLHYYFEEDIFYESEDQADARSKLRTMIYGELYERPYKYAKKPQSKDVEDYPEEAETSEWLSEAEERDITPFQPKKKPTIPYSPPSNVDIGSALPFGSALDAPMQ